MLYNVVNYTVCAAIATIAIAVLWFAGGAIGEHIANEALRSCPVDLVECD